MLWAVLSVRLLNRITVRPIRVLGVPVGRSNAHQPNLPSYVYIPPRQNLMVSNPMFVLFKAIFVIVRATYTGATISVLYSYLFNVKDLSHTSDSPSTNMGFFRRFKNTTEGHHVEDEL